MKHAFSTLAANVTLFLLGIALVALYWTDRLGLYIRPDYHVFSYLMGIILIIVGWAGMSVPPGHHHHKDSRSQQLFSLLSFCVFVCLWAYVVFGPRVSLSARAAVNRGVNQNAAAGAQWSDESAPILSPLLSLAQTESYTLADWTRLLRRDPEPRSHEGKSVDLEGFIQTQSDGTFSLARFIVSCCVVDATPLSLPVDAPAGELKDGQWVRVKGKFAVRSRGDNRVLMISPESIEKIEEPELPYLY